MTEAKAEGDVVKIARKLISGFFCIETFLAHFWNNHYPFQMSLIKVLLTFISLLVFSGNTVISYEDQSS